MRVSKVVVVLKAMPMPMPMINTPARIAMVVTLSSGDLAAGDFIEGDGGVLVAVVALVGLRLILGLITLTIGGELRRSLSFSQYAFIITNCAESSANILPRSDWV